MHFLLNLVAYLYCNYKKYLKAINTFKFPRPTKYVGKLISLTITIENTTESLIRNKLRNMSCY